MEFRKMVTITLVLVLGIAILADVVQTEVVTSIDVDGDGGNLIRHTNGDRNIELLALVLDVLVE